MIGREWIDAKSAHRVLDVRRQRVDAHPERRQLAADAARGRRARVEHRHAGHDRVGMLARELGDARNGGEIVLAVGVDLQRVRATGGVRGVESGEHRDSLAAIDRAADQREPGGFARRRSSSSTGAQRASLPSSTSQHGSPCTLSAAIVWRIACSWL